MFLKNCGCLISIIISIILGVILGITAYSTVIPGIVIALWIAFGIGVASLIGLSIIAVHGKNGKCICKNGICLAFASMGLIITTIIALSITIITGVVSIAVLLGFTTFFLVFTLLEVLKLVLCLVKSNCSCRD